MRGTAGRAHGYLQDVTARTRTASGSSCSSGSSRSPPTRRRRTRSSPTRPGASPSLFGDVEVTYVERPTRAASTSATRPSPAQPEFWTTSSGAPTTSSASRGNADRGRGRRRTRRGSTRSATDCSSGGSPRSWTCRCSGTAQLTGVLWFNSAEPRTWGEHEVSVLVDVAGQLAIVLASARAPRAASATSATCAAATRSSGGQPRRRAARRRARLARRRAGLLRRSARRGASRAYLFETPRAPTASGSRASGSSGSRTGIAAELENRRMQDMCFEEVGLARFDELATATRSSPATSGTSRPRSARSSSRRRSGRSMTVPIFVGRRLVGLHRLRRLRRRSASGAPPRRDALRTAASLVAAAIERERAEAVLREHEQKLRAVFDTALDAIFITDDDRRYVDVNPAGCELIGVAKRDLIGRRVDEFLPPDRLEHVPADLGRLHRGRPRARGVGDDAPRRHGAHLRGVGPAELPPGTAHRLPARHDRSQAARGGAPERAEAREPRPARRRRRTRLQQPADRDHRVRVAAARARRTATRSSRATSARSSVPPTVRPS